METVVKHNGYKVLFYRIKDSGLKTEVYKEIKCQTENDVLELLFPEVTSDNAKKIILRGIMPYEKNHILYGQNFERIHVKFNFDEEN